MADDANDTTADDVVDPDEELVDAADGETEAADEDGSDDLVDATDDGDGDDEGDDEVEAPPASEAKKKADAVIAERRAKDPTVGERKVERRVVTSRRVTPKAGAKPAAAKDAPPAVASKARDAKKTEQVLARTPSQAQAQQALSKGPSPWWVPAIMFGLIIIGGLVIMLNYMGAFGDPENMRLVIGLGFILGGIIAATQYR